MKTVLDMQSEKSMSNFSELLIENFKVSLETIINKTVTLESSEVAIYDNEEVLSNFENHIFVMISESSNELNGGILFEKSHITALTDLMMMGDGTGKDDIEDDDKDAIKELVTQLVSSLNVPFNEKFDATVSFSVDAVEIAENNLLDVFSADQFFSINSEIVFDDSKFPFRFFIEESFTFLLGDDNSDDADNFAQDFTFPDDDEPSVSSSSSENSNIDILLDVDIPVSVKIGSTRMFLKDIIALGPGNIVELEEYADEPVELTINDKVIARGEVVIVDGYFGLRIKEIVSRAERIQKLKD